MVSVQARVAAMPDYSSARLEYQLEYHQMDDSELEQVTDALTCQEGQTVEPMTALKGYDPPPPGSTGGGSPGSTQGSGTR